MSLLDNGVKNLTISEFGPNLEQELIYNSSIYNPKVLSKTSLTFEILNGGLHYNHYVGNGYTKNRTVTPEKIQYGSFAQGFYFGFDRSHFICAEQQSPEPLELTSAGRTLNKRIPHSSLCADVFIPFQPSLVLFGFQALFCQETTMFHTRVQGLKNKEDFFDVSMKAGMTENISTTGIEEKYYHKLPTTRLANGPGGRCGVNRINSELPLPDEDSWRFVSRQGQISGSNVRPGYFTCQVSIGALSHNDDIKKQKLHTPSGGVWILALR
tara:strand:- start:4109 stop:4912 length:804 start_codon:yes stop_codon:yes gene_type:complete